MTHIGLLSDTHGFLYPEIFDFFKDCSEVWHAGDIGTSEIADHLGKKFIFRAVTGNIDGNDLRMRFPGILVFKCEDVKVVMTHIAGYPGTFNKTAREIITREKPKLFIAGHSHILKVMYDKQFSLLYINPGASGKYGFHQYSTAVRFRVNTDRIENLEVFNIQKLR